jgi:hypothetical protein
LKKNSDLKKIIKDDSIECDNLTINSLFREAIWNKYKDDLQLSEYEVDVTNEDAKRIWEKLQMYLLVYSLFQSVRKKVIRIVKYRTL